jgi:hypothetical protein
MPNLNQFISEFRDGFQQNNRFTAQVFVPSGLLDFARSTEGGSDNSIIQIIDLLFPNIGRRVDPTFSLNTTGAWLARGLVCDATRLPDKSFETAEQTMYGITENFPVHTTFTDLTCNFLLPLYSNDNAVPRFFNYWFNFIQNQSRGLESGMNFSFPDDYRGQLLLSTIDRKDHVTSTYYFDRVFPKTLQSVELSWDATNEVAKLPVDFTYSYWTLLPYQPPPIVEINTPLGTIGIGADLNIGGLPINL